MNVSAPVRLEQQYNQSKYLLYKLLQAPVCKYLPSNYYCFLTLLNNLKVMIGVKIEQINKNVGRNNWKNRNTFLFYEKNKYVLFAVFFMSCI